MKQTITLNNGYEFPIVGLGTWQAKPGQVGAAITHAILEAGYRHIDGAAVYGNEPEIGQAYSSIFSTGTIKREEVFITSKLWNTQHHPDRVEAACRQTLQDLQLEYLDLYLMHWGLAFAHTDGKMLTDEDGKVKLEPVALHQTWQAMEQLVDKGLVKSIGVSNFSGPMLQDLLNYTRIKPVTNQIEVHLYLSQESLVQFCQKRDVVVTAYSPLGSVIPDGPKPLKNEEVAKIAQKYSKTPAQVLLRWLLQRGVVAIPKSITPSRITENIQVFDFELSDSEMSLLNQQNKNHRFVDPSDSWGVPYFT